MSVESKLTPAQRRVLLSMHPTRPTDVWRLAWKLNTVQGLDAQKIIARGQRGWIDAQLTEYGQEIRAQLESGAMQSHAQAARALHAA